MLKNKQEILITGAAGMVGSYASYGFKTTRNELDVTDLKQVRKRVEEVKPRVIIHLACLTDHEECERNPEKAYLINAVGTYHMALAAREAKAKLIYVSTSGIFDGTKRGYEESDLPNPQSVYGHTKYAGELIIQSLLKDFMIVRASWIFGGGPNIDHKFVSQIIKQFDIKTEIEVTDDTFGSPLYAKDLMAAIKTLIEENDVGIFHISSGEEATRYDIAKAIALALKPQMKIVPVSSDHFKRSSFTQKSEVLLPKKKLVRPWKEALKEYLEEEWR